MDAAQRFFLDRFPRGVADLPPGKDWFVHVVCHCALGSISRVLLACGLDPEDGIPWSRGWFVRYPLPDGGFNCHEDTYLRSASSSASRRTGWSRGDRGTARARAGRDRCSASAMRPSSTR